MPQDRFFMDASFGAGQELKLEEAEFHHLKVMRSSTGDEIELVNGRGALARARIVKLEKQTALLRCETCEERPQKSPKVALGLALIRLNRLEWTIEKATELGADALFLFTADLSEKEALSPHQLERLRHLTISALKQCGSLHLPHLSLLPSLDAILHQDRKILYGDTRFDAPRLRELNLSGPIVFLTGPEKGFSQREKNLLVERGEGVQLNQNILRAETAPIAALSILLG